jgi:hypothetical protein
VRRFHLAMVEQLGRPTAGRTLTPVGIKTGGRSVGNALAFQQTLVDGLYAGLPGGRQEVPGSDNHGRLYAGVPCDRGGYISSGSSCGSCP